LNEEKKEDLMSRFVEDWANGSALRVIAIAYTDLD